MPREDRSSLHAVIASEKLQSFSPTSQFLCRKQWHQHGGEKTETRGGYAEHGFNVRQGNIITADTNAKEKRNEIVDLAVELPSSVIQ